MQAGNESEVIAQIEEYGWLIPKDRSFKGLLTLEQEQDLGRKLKNGGRFISIASTPVLKFEKLPLRPNETKEAWNSRTEEANQAWQTLIEANSRLVSFVAKRFIGRGVELAD